MDSDHKKGPHATLRLQTNRTRHPTKLTLQEAVHKAVEWHPTVRSAAARLREAEDMVNEASANYLPKIRGGIKSAYGDDNNSTTETYLSVSQSLYDFGKIASSVDAAIAGQGVANSQLIRRVDTIIRDTAKAVVEVQRGEALLKVAQTEITALQNIRTLIAVRTETGAVSRSDLAEVDSRIQAIKIRTIQLVRDQNSWLHTLTQLTGYESVRVDEGSPSWLSNQCGKAEANWSQIPTVLEAESKRREAEALVRKARAESLPNFAVEGRAAVNGHGDASATIGLNLSSDIYQGGANRARYSAATHALSSAIADAQFARSNVKEELSRSRDESNSLDKLLLSTSTQVKLAEKTRNLYEKQYLEMGTKTLLDLLSSLTALYQAKTNVANAYFDARNTQLYCLYISGNIQTVFGISTPHP